MHSGASGSHTNLSALQLIVGNVINVYPEEVFELPLLAGCEMQVGAISLILDFPVQQFLIQEVYLQNDPQQPVEFAVVNDQLRIGWHSSTPLNLITGDVVLTIRAQNLSRIPDNEVLSFTLANSDLNEIANAQFEVIENAVLTIDSIAGNTVGVDDLSVENLRVDAYPNPANHLVSIAYTIPSNSTVSVSISTANGTRMIVLNDKTLPKGTHFEQINIAQLPKGVYILNVKTTNGQTAGSTSIKLVKM